MSTITLAHGGGGTLQNSLIRNEIASRFTNSMLSSLPDGATTPEDWVISTDSFVITPRFFPGGNIGELAVTGSVNDVLMAGGIPRYLTCSLIIEEGLELEELRIILDSMQSTAEKCRVKIITGDTKVVPQGAGDGLYINTTAVGFRRSGMMLGKERLQAGDKIIVSRTVGEHGLSIMASRCQLNCGTLTSDCAPLTAAVESLHKTAGSGLKFMRDATRGGVLGIIEEIFENTPFGAVVYEDELPVLPQAAAVAKLLGIEPGFSACEGCMVAVTSAETADECVSTLHSVPGCSAAAVIGEVSAENTIIQMRSSWGALRKLQVPAGDQLPRIC